ncbi:hypothetical protein AVEN_39212-1 [Araneus ventricosus]|uniref:CCHC-type domain-containing protein n=1 Tax=Araneus ventricosus TaxID=182803 RepID=A0A4Y2UTR8_ARAVE|nr:hypothetical protein AVEN_39212-1 [Araneus ventricosus]
MTFGATRTVRTPENVESISRAPQYELICSEAFLPNDYRGHSSELDLGNRSAKLDFAIFHPRGTMEEEKVTEKDAMDFFQELEEWSNKEKEGRLPTEQELATCASIQEQDKRKILTRQLLRKARKRLKKTIPNSEAGIKAANDVDRFNRAMEAVNRILTMYGGCPVLNCTKHPSTGNEATSCELDATSCTEMDTTSLADDQEQTTTPPVEVNSDESEFQMVPPRKAAKIQKMEEAAPPIETGNRFQKLADGKSYPASISLKPQGNYKQIIKEIAEKFPGTENRWIYDFINIKPTSEECRIQILALLNEKNAEYLLNESSEERPIKIVIKNLSEDTDPQDIVEDLTSKGYGVNRITQMKNYKLKRLLPMFLVEIKKIGNFTNIYNERSICYFRAKIETYRKKAKATICYNCSGFYHAARNCHLKPKCIKCGGEHPTRECNIKEKITEPKCVNCGESGHLAAWKGCKSYPVIKKPSYRQTGRSYAAAAAEKIEQPIKKKTEERTSPPPPTRPRRF